MSPMRLAPVLGRSLSLALLQPWLTRALLKRLKTFQHATVAAIARSLRVGHGQAFAIYRRSLGAYVRFNIDHFFLCRSDAGRIRRKMDGIRVLGHEKLTPFLTPGEPVLIVTMHMGDFQLGFLKLVSSIRSERKVSVFKMSQNDRDEDILFAAFQREKQQVQALRAGADGGRQAYLELRKGNVVTMTVDLEVHVTSRSTVEFFGRPCRMQNGPATLATLTRATIVPIVNYLDPLGVPTIRVEDPISTRPRSPDERPADIIDRVTQQIAGRLESWIRIDPAQVHAWSALAETIHQPETAGEER